MYTLIEIFDAKQYENIITPVSIKNLSKLIYIGSKEIMTKEKIDNITFFFHKHKFEPPIEFLYVERDNSASLNNRLEQIIKSNDNCVFDVTGGEDSILALVGICAERYSVPIIRTNAKTGNISIIHGYMNDLQIKPLSLDVPDFICLQGGRIRHFTTLQNLSDEDISDIKKLFYVNGVDCEGYSAFCSFASEFISDDGKILKIPENALRKKSDLTMRTICNILNMLCTEKLLTKTNRTLTYKIKSELIKSCLQKSGNVLEYYVALTANDLQSHFSNIRIGTSIEWNDSKNTRETQNEIDVLAISNNLPVFISCKNGEVKKEALYELDAVSRALGGAYVKTILVCTYVSKNKSAREHFIKRAHDMNIHLVYDAHKLTYEKFMNYLKKR